MDTTTAAAILGAVVTLMAPILALLRARVLDEVKLRVEAQKKYENLILAQAQGNRKELEESRKTNAMLAGAINGIQTAVEANTKMLGELKTVVHEAVSAMG